MTWIHHNNKEKKSESSSRDLENSFSCKLLRRLLQLLMPLGVFFSQGLVDDRIDHISASSLVCQSILGMPVEMLGVGSNSHELVLAVL